MRLSRPIRVAVLVAGFALAPAANAQAFALTSLDIKPVARLKAGWQAEYELWRARSVADLYLTFPRPPGVGEFSMTTGGD